MATLTSYDFGAKPLPWGHAAKATIERILASVQAWREQRRTVARVSYELGCHSDRELRDMGFSTFLAKPGRSTVSPMARTASWVRSRGKP